MGSENHPGPPTGEFDPPGIARTFRDLAEDPECRRGLVGILAFFASLGALFLFASAGVLSYQAWVNATFARSSGLVLDKRVATDLTADSGRMYRPEVLIRYVAGGREYEAWTLTIVRSTPGNKVEARSLLDRYRVGRRYPCWYDPRDPRRAILDRGLPGIPIGISLFSSCLLGGCLLGIFRLKTGRWPGPARPGGPPMGDGDVDRRPG